MRTTRTKETAQVQALVAALDQAIAGLTAARKIAAHLEHRPASSGRWRGQRASAATTAEDAFERAFREGTPLETRPLEEMSASVHEAAEQLGIGEEQVRRLLRSGELLGVPYGGRRGWRISRGYLEAIAAERRRAKEQELQPA